MRGNIDRISELLLYSLLGFWKKSRRRIKLFGYKTIIFFSSHIKN
jgi:hypothetical protein